MKFAHLADCHIGAWRDPQLKILMIDAFVNAISTCITKKVDFVLISGDLFNTALPGIDDLKMTVKHLCRLKDNNIPVYIIAGSHDYSPSGKTMIDVLEEVGLVTNVVKGTVHENKLQLKVFEDPKTKIKIAGMLGKRGQLEKAFYESLDIEKLEKEKGFKIFLFHSAIRELMPKEFALMEMQELSSLPKGWNYYAGGHIHIIKEHSEKNYSNVVYPGPLFPASFSELEKLGNGGFFIYEDGKITREEINLKNIFRISIDANHRSPEEVERELNEKIAKKEFVNTIVLLKVFGVLKTGKVTDIHFREIFRSIYTQGAYFIVKSTTKLLSSEFEEVKIDEKNLEEAEDAIIKEHLQQVKVTGLDKDKEYALIKKLLLAFEEEKHEGEKVYEYEDRMRKVGDKILEL
ncbi:MAG: exonuclease SbcCD subunit D [Candidatus Woesearchaeota archaeon]